MTTLSDGGWDADIRNLMTNLLSRVGQQEGTLRTFMEQWRDQDNAANLGRRVTHERMELLAFQIERVANDVLHIQQDLAELKKEIDEEISPVIRLSEFARERKAGAKAAVATVWAGLVVLISMLAYAADKLVSYLFPRP